MSRGGKLVKVPTPPGRCPAPGKHYYRSEDTKDILEVDTKYELEKLIGSGVYGVVCSAVNTETNERVAVKKSFDVFEYLGVATRALREIRLLRQIDHPSFPKVKDVMVPPSPDTYEDVYLVQELMYNDLYNFLKTHHVTDRECRHFLFQLLRGLEYLHAGNVLHRDLKPSNTLINENGDLKICDFGLARNATETPMTSEVVTLGYRAPELLLQVATHPEDVRVYITGTYRAAIDVWSAGCIFAQLLRGGSPRALFSSLPETGQLRDISHVIPKPDDDDLDFIRDRDARKFVKESLGSPKTSLREIFQGEDEEAIDLLEKMLVFNPRYRISAADALKHPYLAREREQAPPQILPRHQIDEGPMPATIPEARRMIRQEMLYFHPDQRGDEDAEMSIERPSSPTTYAVAGKFFLTDRRLGEGPSNASGDDTEPEMTQSRR